MGVDYNKLVLLLAVLEKRCGVNLSSSDVYVNAMGGIKLNEPSCDLAVCAALASAYFGKPIDKYGAGFFPAALRQEYARVIGYGNNAAFCHFKNADFLNVGGVCLWVWITINLCFFWRCLKSAAA